MQSNKIIAVDFDGTLCTNAYPGIGEPNWELIAELRERKANGDKLILWTMREGEMLQNALDACSQWGLAFNAVNDNLKEITEAFRCNPRKVFANIYIDDHNAKETRLPYETYEKVDT